MTIEKIRALVKENINKPLSFRVNGSRNQDESFHGVILDAYNAVFIVRNVEQNFVRSFSYTDILIGNLEFKV